MSVNSDLASAGASSLDQQDPPESRSSQLKGKAPAKASALLNLPTELIDGILSHLSPYDLARVSATNHGLHARANSDYQWQRCVQENVPYQLFPTPGPCSSFRELYSVHDLLWFLPKYKIWFCDRDMTGRLLIVRFDQRRGCIEGYQLLAVCPHTPMTYWPANPEVVIHGFEPRVKLHLDKPVLHFRVQDRQEDGGFSTRPGANRFADEMPMVLEDRISAMFSNFSRTRSLDCVLTDSRIAAGYPYDHIWPPPAIPARHRVCGAPSGETAILPRDRPSTRSEMSDQTFRIRQWMEMAGTPAPPGLVGQTQGFTGLVQVLAGFGNMGIGGVAQPAPMGIHLGEEIITYSTLDPALYTPTATKPWRGIWVGDYSGHGCEFLLVNQPDDEPAADVELGLVRGDEEEEHEWQQRRLEARIYRGRLEAIKLTGDPNVPRGEYTFVADDLGPAGYIGMAMDAPFSGARVVRSKGHVAATGFNNDKFIESQLILISHNRLAQYWLDFGHISFFDRVRIDDFVVP
ncbi:hypothetical protein HIM_05316 [Hirsutella minnesotensis 3608]|uniref:F-box domain-containing protein n=1 Tax=Hirsutella minnesotensis 3608 TaxID=1043627 RepID=A0A0F7ZPF1_9HYPO|nr:hypothetical protein HIM_05316 [Hirsutella minnesotensis 3608]